jgi:D-alanyl-D-alanine carboxypeptidase/D-alanyl-D-alanine-endopeptidase (penicillin-binding protein 4)
VAQSSAAPSAPAPAAPAVPSPQAPDKPLPAAAADSESSPSPPPADKAAVPPLTPPPSDPTQRMRWLGERIDLLVQQIIADRARVGIAVLDVDSGRLLYGRSDNVQFNIASNVKLFTSAAALALLGPEYRFKTALYGERDKDRSELKSLYLRGYGDPTLSTEDLWRLTSELSARGIKKIKGDIFIDDTFFDEQRVAPAFEQKNEDRGYRAPQGAVSLNYNAVGVHVYPGLAEGQPARVLVDPPSPYFIISNETRTVQAGRTSLAVESQEEKDAPPGREHTLIRVRGTIKLGDSGQDYSKRIAHPDLYAAWTLYELLTRRGIQVGGKPSRGTAPQTAQMIDFHYSQPLGVLVRDVNKRSNNFMAEMVLKGLGADSSGRPGSWQKGLQAVSRYLEGLGILPGKYQMQNGSGLYDSNRFTPAQVVTLLRAAYRDFRISADFVASLALAGADGTIFHRMSGSIAERYVRAKTGTLNGVSCLSGFAGAPLSAAASMRSPLAFSVLINDHEDSAAAKRLQDSVVEALVAYQAVPGGMVAAPPSAPGGPAGH